MLILDSQISPISFFKMFFLSLTFYFLVCSSVWKEDIFFTVLKMFSIHNFLYFPKLQAILSCSYDCFYFTKLSWFVKNSGKSFFGPPLRKLQRGISSIHKARKMSNTNRIPSILLAKRQVNLSARQKTKNALEFYKTFKFAILIKTGCPLTSSEEVI